MFSTQLKSLGLIATTLFTGVWSQGLTLTEGNDDTYKKAANTAADNMMSYYHGEDPGGIPGLLGDPYYWWEAGAMFGQLIHNWHLTGNTKYNEKIMNALLFQIGDDKNYMPANRSKDLVSSLRSPWQLLDTYKS